MSKPSELYACLYVKEFPAQALLRLRPELHDKPCVVMEGEPPFEVVCSLNTKARLLGLRHGMTRVEVDTFTGPVVLMRSLQMEKTTKAVLLECAGAFSPRIGEASEGIAFLCIIDIAGTQNLFGPPEMLAKDLRQRVSALGLSGQVTVSSNFHAAVCFAKGLTRSAVQIVPAGKEAVALSSLPLTTLDLTENQAETFALWGIHTLGMLAALPEKELIARMGQDGKRLRQLACGEHNHLFQPIDVPFVLEERAELDFPLEDLESLLFGLSVMLEQLILRATARIVALATVTIVLHLNGGGSHSRTVRPAQPSNDKQFWLKLLHLDLEAHPPQAAILSVVLHAEPGNTSKVQLGLFSPQLPEAGRLDVTLARIAALVGESNVGQAVLDDTHTPEGFHMEPFQVSSAMSETLPARSHVCLRHLRPPQPMAMLLESGRPKSFFFRNQRCIVERAYGPWLKGGEWWNETIWGHEQWDVIARFQDDALLFCCVIRDLIEDQWQVVALYD
ncbi:MAG TPA: DNA polymerase Y family protein [Edaphobacter sp.]|nr:DNA polymerase Y family protein [Edaphobacter sp.]